MWDLITARELDMKYFACDFEGKMFYFNREGEARNRAKEFIEHCRDDNGGWMHPEEEIQSIRWGIIRQVATITIPRPDEWEVRLEDI